MKKSIFAFLGILCLAGTTAAQQTQQTDSTPPSQGWVQLTSGTTAGFNFISLVGRDTVYVSGDQIVRSTDAGTTWEQMPQLPLQSGRLQFVDDSVGFLSGSGALYKTIDGGVAWQKLSGSWAIFGSQNRGILSDGNYYTSDGGATWHSTSGDPVVNVNCIIFADSVHAYAMGESIVWGDVNGQPRPMAPASLRSSDGGATWQDVYSGRELSKEIWGMAAISADTLIAVGLQIGRTNNATAAFIGPYSQTVWDTAPYPGDGYNSLFAVTFPDSYHGTAVGTGGFIFHTTDAGLTWQRQYPPYLGNYGAVAFADSNLGYACGTQGVIIKTTNAGLSWVQLFPGLDSVQASVYPNPSNAQTSISYMLPQPQHVTLTILDLSGNVVMQVLTGVLQNGSESINMNTSQLASGTYIYSLNSENYHTIGKIEVIH
ncbi:MAG TPA: T9SS type A sorting domain-containing protein [Candidatus Kapabacteria bacterium]|nr:T9SS type A sorting domain-containing protein [Candidatus Kapabacteria bacterium]